MIIPYHTNGTCTIRAYHFAKEWLLVLLACISLSLSLSRLTCASLVREVCLLSPLTKPSAILYLASCSDSGRPLRAFSIHRRSISVNCLISVSKLDKVIQKIPNLSDFNCKPPPNYEQSYFIYFILLCLLLYLWIFC